MRIDILGLQAFIGIADRGSFQAAAATLNLSQTALSHRLAKLEAELGVSLITRTTRHISLTQEGIALLPRARELVDELQTTLTDIKLRGQRRQTKVVLGCMPSTATHVLAAVLKEFADEEPDIRIKVIDGYAFFIAEQVNLGRAEFGLIVMRATHYELDFIPLLTERFVVVCHKDHPLATRTQVTIAELSSHIVIRNSVVADALLNSKVELSWHYEVEYVSTALGMVSEGIGVTIVPSLGLRLEESSPLVSVELVEPSIVRNIGIVTRPDMPPSAAAQKLIRYLVRRMPQIARETGNELWPPHRAEATENA